MQTIYQIDKKDLQEVLSQIVLSTLADIPKAKEEPRPDRITIDEAAELTGLKIPQIYKLTHRREIPFKKFGKRLVFSRREIQQWIDYRTQVPKPSNIVENAICESAARKSLSR